MIFTASRSCGTKTNDSMPARAAWAATELARLPVEAHAATLKPSSRALVSATADHAVLERARRVASVVLHPDLAEPELGGEPVGADERGEARAEVDRRLAPRPEGGPRNATCSAARPRCVSRVTVRAERIVVVGDLERPETELAHVQRLGRVACARTPDSEDLGHDPPNPPHRSGIGTWHGPEGWCWLSRLSSGPIPRPLWMIGHKCGPDTWRPYVKAGAS